MTVIVERAIVAVVKLEAPTIDDANQAFADLRSRVEFSLPKRRFRPCTILERFVDVRSVKTSGHLTVRKTPPGADAAKAHRDQ